MSMGILPWLDGIPIPAILVLCLSFHYVERSEGLLALRSRNWPCL